MDGAAAPKSLADYGHTEPQRGAEWWGKSVLLTFALFKSEPLLNCPRKLDRGRY